MAERSEIHTTKALFPYSTKFYEIIGLTVTHITRNNAKKFPDNNHLGWRIYDKETKKYVYFFLIVIFLLNRVIISLLSIKNQIN
jgi:hypothetical protein